VTQPEEFSFNNENDPVSKRNGYTNSGFKRCIDVGWKFRYKDNILTVIDIDHMGYPDVQKVRAETPRGKPSWYLVESIEIFSKEEFPEYYL
jgi:hypothetical protein